MTPITPNPFAGVSFHAVGAMFAANCYAPQKYIRRWSWQTFWMTQAAWCWLLWPIIVAAITIPHLWQVLAESPKEAMLGAFALGVLYGIGGTAFNLSIRYIGFALTYAIAIGLSCVLGTFVPPIVRGKLHEMLEKPGVEWAGLGLLAGALGIAICGLAGRYKELDLKESAGGPGEFCLWKGLLLSILAGVLSAFYGFSLETAQPVIDLAEKFGAGQWKGNVAYLFSNTGAFVTALAYSLYLARKNKSLGELVRLKPGEEKASLLGNYLLAMLTGTLWFGQIFFYNLGHVRMGKYLFISWGVHMIMLVLFSNALGVLFNEWRGCRARTYRAVAAGLFVLVVAVSCISYATYLGENPPIVKTEAAQ